MVLSPLGLVALVAVMLAALFSAGLTALPTNADDVALLRAALEGRAAARNRLVVRLAPVVRARLRRALCNWPGGRLGAHDVDDLTHLTWCRLLEHDAARLRAYDPATGVSLVAYVSMVTQQLFLNVLEQHRAGKRAAAATVDLEDAGDVPAPVDAGRALEARADLERVHGHLQRELPERGRAVLALLYVDGLDVDQTAAALGVNKQVVYNWQFKIRQLARAFFEAGGEDATP
jgi:RNA polymerase sigma factor (sigma-70 family)